jgi:hypothetical protein
MARNEVNPIGRPISHSWKITIMIFFSIKGTAFIDISAEKQVKQKLLQGEYH